MKRAILLPILFLISAMIHGYPVLITSWNLDTDIKTLNKMGISVDNVTRSAGTIVADVRDDLEYARLLDSGFRVNKLPDLARENALRMQKDDSTSAPKEEYYTFAQYQQFMIDTAAQYPAICQLIQAGSSIQNRPIYFLKITDNPNIEEDEPEFKFISTIHGNEIVGYAMCIYLIQQLTSEYGTSTRIANLVNDTEIYICPLMNPDGYVLGQRANAAGIDMNRNFPMPTGNQHPDGNNWAPEVQAVMSFSNSHNFILSANFHCGALVMNYPWDYTYTFAPDDAMLQSAALTYSIHNTPMYNSTEFVHGITNGAAWYVATGTMQDWNYGLTDDTDITAEISNAYTPAASTLPTYWSQNQESMLSYMEFVHKGIHGLVTSSTGTPLSASVTIQGNSKIVRTDPAVGDYHRMLLPGTYTVTVDADGYLPQTAQITVPALGYATRDFVMQQAQTVDFTGQLRTIQGVGIAGATVTIDTTPVSSATTDANGSFQFTGVAEGSYTINFSSGISGSYSKVFLLTEEESRQIFVWLEPQVLFNDPCNNINNWTATSPWGITTYQGESVITDSPAGNYANNINKVLRLTNPIALQNITQPKLTFKTRYDLEANYDFVYVAVSTNNSTWDILASITGTQTAWQNLSFDLDQYAGQSLYVRFMISSDYSETADGIYLDDIQISGISPTQVIFGDADGNGIITKADAQIIASYSVALDPLPELDPLPWEATRITACDVNTDLVLTPEDAYLVIQYLLVPAFRFEAQSGEEEVLGTSSIVVSHNGGNYSFNFDPQEAIKCFKFSFLPVDGVTLGQINWPGFAGTPVFALNPVNNQFVWIRGSENFNGVQMQIQTVLDAVTCLYSLNGVDGSVTLHPGSANDDPSVPGAVFILEQNTPNPFNPTTTIRYSVTNTKQPTLLQIFNCKGQLVRTLVNAISESGFKQISWDGRDDAGSQAASGIYFYRLQNAGKTTSRKMILIK